MLARMQASAFLICAETVSRAYAPIWTCCAAVSADDFAGEEAVSAYGSNRIVSIASASTSEIYGFFV